MTPPSLQDAVGRLTELLERASARPWEVQQNRDNTQMKIYASGSSVSLGALDCYGANGAGPTRNQRDANAALIIEAINALPSLLSTLVEMRGAIEKRPNIYWDFDDPESGYDGPDELAETVWTGAPMVVRVQRAVRLSDAWISIRWPDDGELEATEHETEEAARQALQQKESAK